jgi:N-acetylmuramoyl-L-alanine amidase
MAALLEICFISNTEDLAKYNEAKHKIAKAIAAVLVKWAKA